MRSARVGSWLAVAGAALLALPATAQEDEGEGAPGGPPPGGRLGREGLGPRDPNDPRMRMMGRGQEQPPAMAVSGGKLFVVFGRELRRLDALTLAEEKKAGIPAPGMDDEAATRIKEGFMKRFDTDGDGFISEDEVPRPEIFRKLDRDGDGKVSISEAPGGQALAARLPAGPATLLVEKGNVYVFQGGTLFRFDAESLELKAQAELAPPPGIPGMKGGRERPDKAGLGEDRPRRDRLEKRGRGDAPDEPRAPEDPVRF